jgi:hypothetical protein
LLAAIGEAIASAWFMLLCNTISIEILNIAGKSR